MAIARVRAATFVLGAVAIGAAQLPMMDKTAPRVPNVVARRSRRNMW